MSEVLASLELELKVSVSCLVQMLGTKSDSLQEQMCSSSSHRAVSSPYSVL